MHPTTVKVHMATAPHPVAQTHLAELVQSLSGTSGNKSRDALSAAVAVHGNYGDPLLIVAGALVNLRERI